MKKRFLGWLVWFLLCLIAVPLLIYLNFIVFAKIVGVLTVVSLVIALRFWLHRSKKEFNPIERIKINTNDRYYLNSTCTFYKNCTNGDKLIFESRLGIFLAKTKVYTNSDLSREDYILLASLFICVNWNDADWYATQNKNIAIEITERSVWQITMLDDLLIRVTTLELRDFNKIPVEFSDEQRRSLK